MFSKFLSLETEKRDRILNAALDEFVQKGYYNASTNEIVKKAGISKGLLFHYFKNKKQLYLYLYDYTLDIFEKEFFEKMDSMENDIFTKMRQIVLLKLELIYKHPDMFNFLLAAVREESPEITLRNKELIERSYVKILENIDLSSFKEDLDIPKAINIIVWTLQGFSNEVQEKIKFLSLDEINYDEILAKMDGYLELLRKSFYK
ncbi:TetR/AcrR family transcriptional regulator [Neobacillus notoginsengisoli]|uniref:TetR/AcrR family transcriptional regulator n=1 Tax=Neobacillus notoginsengisoli TaxID=1578198 RepID=A0A417Z0S8_9BACI|nr:TetR/AcrR family transcriptional regulator [Neobacillus notoginsengisoli]RHW43554.1 TetR/AcrR family transcriptional regulator [Neobacillus notoginsengisoli]